MWKIFTDTFSSNIDETFSIEYEKDMKRLKITHHDEIFQCFYDFFNAHIIFKYTVSSENFVSHFQHSVYRYRLSLSKLRVDSHVVNSIHDLIQFSSKNSQSLTRFFQIVFLIILRFQSFFHFIKVRDFDFVEFNQHEQISVCWFFHKRISKLDFFFEKINNVQVFDYRFLKLDNIFTILDYFFNDSTFSNTFVKIECFRLTFAHHTLRINEWLLFKWKRLISSNIRLIISKFENKIMKSFRRCD